MTTSTDLERRLRELHRCNMPACTDRHPCDGLDHVYRVAALALEAAAEYMRQAGYRSNGTPAYEHHADAIRALLPGKGQR